ncbi:MAG: hypothetical protein NTY02_12895, partial [Acidobacteria bacterium]|nr:hypothetical protein [Acidobacteriota bacterium]
MNAPLRRSLLALLHGTTLATIFFYPLLQVLNGDIYYLSWQWRDTVEFAMAFALLSVVFAVAWAGIERLGSPRWQLVCIFALAFLPVAAFLVTLLRQLPIKEELVPLLSRRTAFLATAAGLSALGIGCLLKWPSLALAFAKRSLQVLSPVSLVVVFTLGNLADYRSY